MCDFRICNDNNQAIEFYLVENNDDFLCAFPTIEDMNKWKKSCCVKSSNDYFLKGSDFCIKVFFHHCSMGIQVLQDFNLTGKKPPASIGGGMNCPSAVG